MKTVLFKKILLPLVVLSSLAGLAVWSLPFLPNVKGTGKSISVYIPTGSSWETAMDSVRPALRFPWLFMGWASIKSTPDSVKGGHYLLKPTMGNRTIFGNIAGGWQDPVEISFHSVDDMASLASKLDVQLEADSASLYTVLRDTAFWRKNGGWAPAARLSAFVPNTYQVYWNASATEILQKILEGHASFWTEEKRAAAKKKGLTPLQVATLASIVQKETAHEEEMARVAGLYLNRLHQGILLQSDPTVIYAYKQSHPKAKTIRRVLNYMLRAPGPYNTYQVQGLPPGPIAVAEIQSMNAVLSAEKHRYIFMCANPDRPGTHRFAVDDVAHEKNRMDYIRWLNKQKIYH